MTPMEECRFQHDAFLKSTADGPASARAWHSQSGMEFGFEYWMLFLQMEAGENRDYETDVKLEPHGPLDGNVVIEDVVVSARH